MNVSALPAAMAWPAADVERVRRALGDGVALIVGATDTGKSTLARQLWAKAGGEVVDGDLGQAWIGPPTLLSRGVPGRGAAPSRMRDGVFIGSTTPVRHALDVVRGTARLAARAARPCVVDADGFVAGSAARTLKGALLDAVGPDVLVLLERQRELSWYAAEAAARGIRVLRLKARHAGAKPLAERARRRQAGFARALRGGRLVAVDARRVAFANTLWNRGERVRAKAFAEALDCPVLAGWQAGEEALVVCNGFPHLVEEAREAFGLRELHAVHANHFLDLLVGLERADADGGAFVALGVTRSVDWAAGNVKVWTRAKSGSFDTVRPGQLRLGGRFHELEHVRIP